MIGIRITDIMFALILKLDIGIEIINLAS